MSPLWSLGGGAVPGRPGSVLDAGVRPIATGGVTGRVVTGSAQQTVDGVADLDPAMAGPLNGRLATTHWTCAAEMTRTFPAVEVDPTVLFLDEGDAVTPAGAATGLDLCLHMVRKDSGAAVSLQQQFGKGMSVSALACWRTFQQHATASAG